MASKAPPAPPAKSMAIVGKFKDTIVEYHKEVDGRVTAIHDMFNQISMTNKRPPVPPQAVAMLLGLTKEQTKPQPGGPVVTTDQILQGFGHMVEPSDTEDTFESKVMVHVRERLKRLRVAKEVFPLVKQPLSDLHAKVEGDTAKLYAWFETMLPEEVRSKFNQAAFCAMVLHLPPTTPKAPLDAFLAGIQNNMDETDTAEKINDAVAKFIAA